MNTGRKIYLWLIQVDLITGVPTGNRKLNTVVDLNYIPPITDYTTCPVVLWEGVDLLCQ